jgi:arginyl-tRNA synthetase
LLTPALREALEAALTANGWSVDGTVPLEIPRQADHGDYASNVALVLAKKVGRPPREVAQALLDRLDKGRLLEDVSLAGPGFVNLKLSMSALRDELVTIVGQGDAYGTWPSAGQKPVLVEFVSANPTGPMNVVNARAGAVGAALVRLFRAAGIGADGEFYVNDAGRQVDLLGASVAARLRERLGEPANFPEDGYQGTYVAELATLVPEDEGRAALARGDLAWFREFALARMLTSQKEDLAAYGVTVRSLEPRVGAARGRCARARARGPARGRPRLRGRGRDLVPLDLVRRREGPRAGPQNGEPSYFLADIAYHREKFQRGYGPCARPVGPGPSRPHRSARRRARGDRRAEGLLRGHDRAVRAPSVERRTGQDVQACGGVRHAARPARGRRPGCGEVLLPHALDVGAPRLRPRPRARAVE